MAASTFQVPRYMLSCIVGDVSVGMPDDELREIVAEKAGRWRHGIDGRKLTPAEIRRCAAYAISLHRANQRTYLRVTRGHIGKGK